MKIAINLTRENIGGITSSNLNLINYLYKHDYDFVGIELSSHMYMKGTRLFSHLSQDMFDHHIINIHNLPLMDIVKKSSRLSQVEAVYAEPIKVIRKILKQTRPDVVFLSGTYYFPWLISIAAKKEKIPVVLWYSGVLTKETEHYKPNAKKIFSAMEKSIVKNSTQIIFPSELCKSTVEELVTKEPLKNGYVIPNPMAGIFTEPCATDSSIERRIAAVGRFSKVKNFTKFFELHTELKKRNWRHTASFVTNISTVNPDPNLKLRPKSIELLPSMSVDGIKKFYLSQGLIVCPSTFETFGNVPMEAACLGIPVLVSDTMGCAEILRKVGLENMVISFDDMDKVVERVQTLCGQSILPKQTNALKRILDNNLISEEIRAVIEQTNKDKSFGGNNGSNGVFSR
jgi:glycosyltransferase involved in cell wall biosynthesis